VFINTPVGTNYDVEENGTPAYKATLVITSNGNEEAALGTGNPLGANVDASGKLVGEAANKAEFKNARDDVTPTGLNLNDIPFIGLILLALGTAVSFVVIKVRRRKTIARVNNA